MFWNCWGLSRSKLYVSISLSRIFSLFLQYGLCHIRRESCKLHRDLIILYMGTKCSLNNDDRNLPITNNHTNSEDRNAPITINHGATYIDTQPVETIAWWRSAVIYLATKRRDQHL